MSITLAAVLWVHTLPSGIPVGTSQVVLDLPVEDGRITVYTYKPAPAKPAPAHAPRDQGLVLVFHGLARNAEEYRDFARGLADRAGCIIAAPEFEEARFPYAKYSRGGVRDDRGEVAPRSAWTWSLVPRIAEALRDLEARPEMPYYLLGHSAGGQFVGRLTGFVTTGARRHVAANPGAYLWPTRDEPFPYGFGALTDEIADDDALRRYLAAPLTIYLGTEDDQRDEDLDQTPEADRQGRHRLDRGRKVFEAARSLAAHRGWKFQWRKIEAPGVGHDPRAMFDDPACARALFSSDP